MANHQVVFDKAQLMLMESALSPSEVSQDRTGTSPSSLPSKELCLKVGSALIQALEGVEAPLVLTEEECWTLRERVNIFTAVGERVDAGLTVKALLYQLLLQYAAEREAGDFSETDYQGRSAQEVKNALEARSHNGPDPDRAQG